MATGHRLLILLCVALLSVQVVRSAVVGALAGTMPQVASKLWAGHPEVAAQLGMVAIASATGQRQPIPPAAFAALRQAAARSPLAAEPLLVRGVQAQVDGHSALSRAAFLAAERRDPRSLPARYFLAEQDLNAGNGAHGLTELGVLAALAPAGIESVAPFVATFARDPRNRPAVRDLLRRNPRLAAFVLDKLAADPANADTVLALTGPASSGPDATWPTTLLRSLTDAGQYAKAYQLWAKLAKLGGVPPPLLFDSNFSVAGPPPPFNWALTTSTVGLAERRPGGQLHILFYGQQDGPLARQLLVLAPGSYRLAMRVSGDSQRLSALRWSLVCARPPTQLASLPLGPSARQAWTFSVPASCPAQWIELAGASTGVPQQIDATISGLALDRVGR